MGCITLLPMTPLYCDPYILDEINKAVEEGRPGYHHLKADVYEACSRRGTRGHLDPEIIDAMVDAYDEDEKQAWSLLTVRGAAAGVVMLPVVWLIARSELRGQTLAATIIGGLFAGLLARLLSPHTQPRLIFASACLMGAVGHIIGAFVVGRSALGGLDEVYVASALPAVSYALPIDYAVGSLIGVAMGLGWAASFLQHEHEDDALPKQALG